MSKGSLTEFLLARIAEDEANIDGDWAGGDGGLHIISTATHERMLRECEAKRRIVSMGWHHFGEDGYADGMEEAKRQIIAELAAVYSDHPDYDQTWAH